jgi:hypothetical protein
VENLRAEVLRRARSGERTNSEYFDKFILFLIEQFTETGKGAKLPLVREGPPDTAGDVGSYAVGTGVMTIGPDFCGLPDALQRKLMGHGFFHRWDDGLDGTPFPPNDAAEQAAFGVMEYL